jgi:hypothetical protein
MNALLPHLSDGALALVRATYGVLLACTLLHTVPSARRFFRSERWGGYAQSSPSVDALQNPLVHPLLMAMWLGCAALLVLGRWSIAAAFFNLLLCRYFFVYMRWRGVLRGMGAPGFMTYWMAAAVFLLELTRQLSVELQSLALWVLQIDYALIMLSAGVYKVTAGYVRNQGMELGMVNPQWSPWWRRYATLPPGHWGFKLLNHLAWSTEIVAAILLLIPPTRPLGALLIIVSFIFIATQIRLGFLCETVILGALLFVPAGSVADAWMGAVAASPSAMTSMASLQSLPTLVAAGLWTYLVFLAFAHAGLFYNFYGRRSLPQPLQRTLDAYTNFFGIIIWRVFSVDVTNFFIQVHRQPRDGRGGRTLLSSWGGAPGGRFAHVGEAIAVTSVFTTLKYHPSNSTIFRDRLLRYARTLPCPAGCDLVFEYISIQKTVLRFTHVPIAEYIVDVTAASVTERVLDRILTVSAANAVSPVHECATPGSYAP